MRWWSMGRYRSRCCGGCQATASRSVRGPGRPGLALRKAQNWLPGASSAQCSITEPRSTSPSLHSSRESAESSSPLSRSSTFQMKLSFCKDSKWAKFNFLYSQLAEDSHRRADGDLLDGLWHLRLLQEGPDEVR